MRQFVDQIPAHACLQAHNTADTAASMPGLQGLLTLPPTCCVDERGRNIEWPASARLGVGLKEYVFPLSPSESAAISQEMLDDLNDARERLVCCKVEEKARVVLQLASGGEAASGKKIFGSSMSVVLGVPFSRFAVKVRRIESKNVENDIANWHGVLERLGDARSYLVPALDVVPDMLSIMLRASGTAADATGQRDCYPALFSFTISACSDLAHRGLEARDWKPDNVGYVDINSDTCRWYILDTAQIQNIEACHDFAASTMPLNSNYRDGTVQASGEVFNGLAATAWASLASMISCVLGRRTERHFWHTREDLYGENVDSGDPRMYGEHPLARHPACPDRGPHRKKWCPPGARVSEKVPRLLPCFLWAVSQALHRRNCGEGRHGILDECQEVLPGILPT